MSLMLWLDCETGGTDAKFTDLFQAAFIATNGRNEELGRLELNLRPETGIYRVTARAMQVNQIDLQEHDTSALTYTKGAEELRNFLAKHRVGKPEQFKVAGWNPSFDVDFVTTFLIPKTEWMRSCRYGMLDIQSVVYALTMWDILPAEYATMHMHEVAAAMGSDIDWELPHFAMQDAEATFSIYQQLYIGFKEAMDAATP
jgi:hypothetical protein